MDQTMVDLSEIDPADFNEEVILFGDPLNGAISIGEVANQMDTIHYEVACLVGKRVPRVYTQNKQIISTTGLKDS